MTPGTEVCAEQYWHLLGVLAQCCCVAPRQLISKNLKTLVWTVNAPTASFIFTENLENNQCHHSFFPQCWNILYVLGTVTSKLYVIAPSGDFSHVVQQKWLSCLQFYVLPCAKANSTHACVHLKKSWKIMLTFSHKHWLYCLTSLVLVFSFIVSDHLCEQTLE